MSATKQYPIIAREGHMALALVVACALFIQFFLGFYAALPAWSVFVLLMFMFRDPTQLPPSAPLAIVSPIHGRVLVCERARDPWLKRDAERIVLVAGLLDMKSIYAPIEGKIVEQWSKIPQAGPDERGPDHANAFHIRTDEDDDIVLVIIRGDYGGRLTFDYNPGERIGHGRRVGYANFGCRAELFLPTDSHYECAVGDRLTAASSIAARLVHLTRLAQSGASAAALANNDNVNEL